MIEKEFKIIATDSKTGKETVITDDLEWLHKNKVRTLGEDHRFTYEIIIRYYEVYPFAYHEQRFTIP